MHTTERPLPQVRRLDYQAQLQKEMKTYSQADFEMSSGMGIEPNHEDPNRNSQYEQSC